MTFCHAVGFGFLLFEALDLPLPAPGSWEQLIARLVAATGGRASGSPSTTQDQSNQPKASNQKER